MDPAGYAAAHDACARADGSDRTWLEVSGPDARDFLQRVLTSDLRALAPGGGQWSALLDGKGHWIADLLLYALDGGDENCFGLDLPVERLDAVAARIEMLHFAERLAVRRPQPAPARLLLLGPAADRTAAALGLPATPDAAGFGTAAAGALRILRRPDRGVPALDLLGTAGDVADLDARLAGTGVPRLDPATLEALRIEAFIPRWGADFDQEAILPGSNEWRRASLSKGCYAGQEVIARIRTYGEAPRQLCRLRGERADAPPPSPGDPLLGEDGRFVGVITSWTRPPDAPGGVGLGALRRRAAADGVRLSVAAEDGAVVTVEVPPKEIG